MRPRKRLPRSLLDRKSHTFPYSKLIQKFSCRLPRPIWDRGSGFRLDFLSKFKAIFETALAHESGPYRGDWLMKKTEGRKSRDTVPLMLHNVILPYHRNCQIQKISCKKCSQNTFYVIILISAIVLLLCPIKTVHMHAFQRLLDGWYPVCILMHLCILKETVSRDFRPSVIFVKLYPWVPWFMG
jgi:hypothetical protein